MFPRNAQRGELHPMVLTRRSSYSMQARIYVTALLSALGAAIGAITAPVLSFLTTVVAQATLRTGRVEYFYGPAEFAIVGAIGIPVLAWLLMRRVPLWRAILEPAVGGVVGTLIALAAIPILHPYPSLLVQPLCVLAGIVGAAVRLRRTHRSVPSVRAASELLTHAAVPARGNDES
jgi:hypothetical protein